MAAAIKSTTKKAATKHTDSLAGYKGPSMDDVLALDDVAVSIAYDKLGVEPGPFRWHDDDPGWNWACWADEPGVPDAQALASLKERAWAHHQRCLRDALMCAYVEEWTKTLSAEKCVAKIEALSGESLTANEKRYSTVEDLRQQVLWLLWPILVKTSKLYKSPEPSKATAS